MDLVTGPLGLLATKLLEVLNQEYKLQAGLRGEVGSLLTELKSVDAFLRAVDDIPWDRLDEQVKVWSQEVRDASYEMEDALDLFLVHVKYRKPGEDQTKLKRAMKKIGNLFSMPRRHEIAAIIQKIKTQVKDMAERRDRYIIGNTLTKPDGTPSRIDPRLAAMYDRVGQIIGIDDSRAKVMSMLSSQPGNGHLTSRVSIVGVGGLGKTTLAKAIYESTNFRKREAQEPKGDDCFDCGAFVSVGQHPDLKSLFKDILLRLDEDKYEKLNMTDFQEGYLMEKIQGILKDKRYFIVIDDIWEPDSWETIKVALVENNRGSKIITTTRKLEVAKEAGKVYELPRLSDDHSKKLFYTRIFGGAGKCPGDQSDDISDKIVRKCGGIPLAIITMASLLAGKPMQIWSEIYSDIGFEQHKDNMLVQNTKMILSFSYYDLPSHLRMCLLYLSAFPEDYIIDKDPLIWMWVAEGFVQKKKEEEGLYELGERYFNDLINRSMIQAVESEDDGTIESCCVHDMILELIRSLSRQVNFITTYSNAKGSLPKNKVRRLAYKGFDLKHKTPQQADNMDISRARSCIACSCDINRWDTFVSFKLLRVLSIDYCTLKEDCRLKNLGKLIHLRYLSLRSVGGVKELPEEIGNLKVLQTLDLDGTEIFVLPSSIVRLTQLVCLSCHQNDWGEGGLILPPLGIAKLTSLEHLTITLKVDDEEEDDDGFFQNEDDEEEDDDGFFQNEVKTFLKELGSLGELRVLEIFFSGINNIFLEGYCRESLRKLSKIQRIKLNSSFEHEVADIAMWEKTGSVISTHLYHLELPMFKFSKLPSSWILRFPCLTLLNLIVATMDVNDLVSLGRLAELRYLNLGDMEATATISKINASDGFFQKLRCLVMRYVMVQFQHEEDSTFSFHIWNGTDPMPFGSRRNNSSTVPSAVMPNLEVLETSIFVRASKDGNCDCHSIGFKHLTSLKRVKALIQCQGASAAEVELAGAEIRNAIDAHPNRPMLHADFWDPQPPHALYGFLRF